MPNENIYHANPEKYKMQSKNYYYKNIEKCKVYMKKYNEKHAEENRNRSRKWAKDNRARHNEHGISGRRKKNGFTKKLFIDTINKQQGKCSICSTILTKGLQKTAACADHNHETNTPRGILCKGCNLMLGHAKDNILILTKAIEYINFWNRTA
jgi:hypothetical protein